MRNKKKLIVPLSMLLILSSVSVTAQANTLPNTSTAPETPLYAEADTPVFDSAFLADAYLSAGVSDVYIPTGMMTTLPEKSINLSSGANVKDPKYTFYPVYTIVYALKDGRIKAAPFAGADTIDMIKKYDSFMLTGMSDSMYQEVSINGVIAYVDKALITADESVISEMKAEDARKAEEARKKAEAERKAAEEAKKRAEEEAARQKAEEERRAAEAAAAQAAASTSVSNSYEQTPVYSGGGWSGSVLTPQAGVNYGPSGKETYYNLDMSGVVNIMRNMGNQDEYWVRSDGAKMLGNYVMVAANLDVHPRGSLVETSMGTGIVADTGGFAAGNPNQVDIATTW